MGDHDENIAFEQLVGILGAARAAEVRDTAIRIFQAASAYALTRGIVIADTKFECGLDEHGTLTLMDEVLTPDSSRFWQADELAQGASGLRQATAARLAERPRHHRRRRAGRAGSARRRGARHPRALRTAYGLLCGNPGAGTAA